MHPRNRYKNGYPFEKLAKTVPQLAQHFITKPDGHQSLNFGDRSAVRLLNKALLLQDYQLDFWDLAEDALCPAVPGRLDYIHALADLIGSSPKPKLRGLDIGTGASLIYPILGVGEYGWSFVATDINPQSIRAAKAIVDFNPALKRKVELRQQAIPKGHAPARIFQGIIKPGERYAFSMCNPPFYSSLSEAQAATQRKWKKLQGQASDKRNFGGQGAELFCPGGEPAFLHAMIEESANFGRQVEWFTTLVSQAGYAKNAKQTLQHRKAKDVQLIPLNAGNKQRRILAWHWR